MLLTGTFSRSVDEKQRISIPKKLRETIGFPDVKSLFIAPGNDGCLAAYTEEGFHQLAAKLALASPTGQDVRAFSRLFYARAEQSEIDSQGRVRIPGDLAKLVNLTDQAMLIGVGDHLEFWHPDTWTKYTSGKQSQFDDISERAFDI